jgi:hypothetical protein
VMNNFLSCLILFVSQKILAYRNSGMPAFIFALFLFYKSRLRLLGRPRRRWLDNITMDLVEVGSGDVESSCEFCIEPSGSIKCQKTIECPN